MRLWDCNISVSMSAPWLKNHEKSRSYSHYSFMNFAAIVTINLHLVGGFPATVDT
jgi:hypothetical protein